MTILCGLLAVGLVSHTLLRHVVQTSPLWIAVVLRPEVAVGQVGRPPVLRLLAGADGGGLARAPRAFAVVAMVACLQLVAFRLSFLPALAHR